MKPEQTLTPQELFLRQQTQKKRQIRAARILLLAAFLILWEAAAAFGWIDSFIFSSPSRITETFWTMCREQELFRHIGITLAETLISFFLVILFGIGIAVLLWLCPRFSSVMEPYLVVLNSLPKSAMAPLLIVWLGANMRTIVVAGMSVAIFGSIISLYSEFKGVDPDAVKLIYTLGGTKRDTLRKVILPSSVPFLLSTFKVNIGLCLVGVVIGEFIGARSGLGYLIIYGSQVFQLNMVIMCIFVLCIIATLLYAAVSFLEKQYLKKH
ncbi:MAG TPA: ABC transporter permease [Candidatus Fusicatenibacter intestinigallinarum]|uniref:ABC transporter permease n=1 Tax=Candidatus Fusicatenibacter intestinigallinarum TaxID=2838598 RepID=A0A9D2NC41_9FIRM|nr:ABC transporter permease [Candidatus Fusicatenibacter intestinigallinarum]